ncbi:hypothetical protein BH09ACT5_BH09ACT5_17640 [soil metagenome]
MTWRAELAGAAQRGELVAYFQPQVDPASGRIVAAEALCRWAHPSLGMIPPAEFIPVAEETGAILEIGAFMLDRACAFAAGFAEPGIEVAVNVSAVQLADPGFSDAVVAACERHALDHSRLTVEVTESRPVLDIPGAVADLARLRDLGTTISMDDFGSGYSSAAQLNSLPFTELKLDQSLVRDDTEETWSRVASLVAIARHRGMRIVAEGIETREQYEHIRDADCDRAQGYFLGMPMPLGEFEAHYGTHQRTPLPAALARPARRALTAAGVRNLQDLAVYRSRDISALHGIGPRTVTALALALGAAGLAFAE